MTLYDLIHNNRQLQFIDALTGNVHQASSFHQSLDIEDRQALVFIYNDNLIGSVEVLLNFLQRRYAVALLSTQLNLQFKRGLEERYQPYYIYDPSRTVVHGYDDCAAAASIRLFKKKDGRDYPIHPAIKLLLSTSGTTGSPKLVKLSNENVVQNAASILDYMPIQSGDVVPLIVPLVFVYGFSIFTTNCMQAGTLVCTNKDILQREFWEEFRKYGYTTISGVPYIYEMLNRVGFFRQQYPSLRYMTQTGGILNHTLIKKIAEYTGKHGIQFFAQYGQTEAAGRMAYLPPGDLLRKGASIGRPIKNGRFEIDERTGELIYYGPNVFGGYAHGFADLDSWQQTDKLYTGDVARVDEEGYYYITGRIKRIMKLFGTRLNLDEVELILKNELDGQTFVCVGVEDKYLLVLHLNEQLEREPVIKVLKEKLNLHPTAVKVKYVAAMPLTPNGKVDYTSVGSLVDQ